MKAVFIYPHDIGARDEYAEEWEAFCLKFGYEYHNIPEVILLTEIQTNK